MHRRRAARASARCAISRGLHASVRRRTGCAATCAASTDPHRPRTRPDLGPASPGCRTNERNARAPTPREAPRLAIAASTTTPSNERARRLDLPYGQAHHYKHNRMLSVTRLHRFMRLAAHLSTASPIIIPQPDRRVGSGHPQLHLMRLLLRRAVDAVAQCDSEV